MSSCKLSIRDLETLSGIKAHTIRMWEQRYHFIKPLRSHSNIRYYCSSELKLILDVALLNKAGHRISQLNHLSVQEIRNTAAGLHDENIVQENKVNELLGAMVDLETDKFEHIIAEETRAKGIELTVTELIYPFLEKSGLLWKTGHLVPASEQLVAHIIRQKLVVAIETTVPRETKKKTILHFLPENDHHELGLLYIYYELKSRGVQCLYLGDNVPLDDLVHIVNEKKPDEVITHLIAKTPPFRTDKYLQQVKQKLPHTRILFSGRLTNPPNSWPENIEWKKEIGELIDKI